MTCDGCNVEQNIRHQDNCTRELFGTCNCPLLKLQTLTFHGRTLELCPTCYASESSLLKQSEVSLHEYRQNVPDSLERRAEAWKKVNCTPAKWQEVFTSERPNWIPQNFPSVEEMNEAMFQFITSMESLEFEIKAKRRAVYDASKELNARLTKEERLALINDPSFQPATNSEFKKQAKERELDEAIKTINLEGATKEQRKSVAKLLKLGMDAEAIKTTVGLK